MKASYKIVAPVARTQAPLWSRKMAISKAGIATNMKCNKGRPWSSVALKGLSVFSLQPIFLSDSSLLRKLG